MNQSDLARRLGVLPQDITNWKRRDLPSDKYLDVANALNRSIDDLLGRHGYEASGYQPGAAPNRIDLSFFRILDVKAACGLDAFNDDYPEIVSSMSMPLGVAQALIGTTNLTGSIKIIVAGKDSMVPTINPDDLLFVDVSIQEYVGETIYILFHGNELVCKRLSLVGKDLTVISNNGAYLPWLWSDKPDATRIVGKVVRALPIAFKKFGKDW